MLVNTILPALVAAMAGMADAQREFTPRPDIVPTPKPAFKPMPVSAPRSGKTCYVKPSCTAGRDDSAKILKAMNECNNGGTVVLDKEYTVCTALDLRFLKHIDIALTGTIKMCPDPYGWQSKLFRFFYQEASSWWVWGGEDINLYGAGTGTIDGNGQIWYDEYVKSNKTLARPHLFIADGWKGGSFTGIKMRQSANWHNLWANSSDVLISDIDIYSRSSSENAASNLDGWDTYRSDNIVIQNSHVEHDDDCVSFKPNSTNIVVQGLNCNSSHGISIGSLAQYPGVFDIVENLLIYNNTLHNATDSARIKIWVGEGAITNPGWIGGGGVGHVKNVTYEKFKVDNNDLAIQITQCYGAINAQECVDHPSTMVLEDILFKDFEGTTSSKNDPQVGTMICSAPGTCTNVRAENVRINTPSGRTPTWSTRYLDRSLLDVNGNFVDG